MPHWPRSNLDSELFTSLCVSALSWSQSSDVKNRIDHKEISKHCDWWCCPINNMHFRSSRFVPAVRFISGGGLSFFVTRMQPCDMHAQNVVCLAVPVFAQREQKSVFADIWNIYICTSFSFLSISVVISIDSHTEIDYSLVSAPTYNTPNYLETTHKVMYGEIKYGRNWNRILCGLLYTACCSEIGSLISLDASLVTCIQWCQRTNFTATGCTWIFKVHNMRCQPKRCSIHVEREERVYTQIQLHFFMSPLWVSRLRGWADSQVLGCL